MNKLSGKCPHNNPNMHTLTPCVPVPNTRITKEIVLYKDRIDWKDKKQGMRLSETEVEEYMYD